MRQLRGYVRHFFFQAEDGIRDLIVTGVQTCALPISALVDAGIGRLGLVDPDVVDRSNLHRQLLHRTADLGRPKIESATEKLTARRAGVQVRSEERRVGKEGRSRWSPYH